MKVVIDGAGEIGSHLAKLLVREGNDVAVIDSERSRLDNLCASVDIEPVEGEPTSLKSLIDAQAGKADLFIAVVPYVDQEVNMIASLFAKNLGAKKVVARIQNLDLLSKSSRQMMRDLGLDMTFCPEKIAADEIVSQLRYNTASDTMDFARGKFHIAAFRLGEDSPIIDMRLVDFTKHFSEKENSQFRVIALSREDKTIIPKFDTKFKYGDMVYIITKSDGVKSLNNYLGLEDIAVKRVMIMGGGSVGAIVASFLVHEVSSVKLIELKHDRCLELVEELPEEVEVVNGDARNSDFLYEQGLHTCDAFVAVTGSDEANILACVAAKKFGVSRTVAEVENMEYVRLAEEMGVDVVINKKLTTASRIYKLTLSDRAKFVRYMSGTDAEVMEYTAAEGSAITKDTLKNIDFPSDAVIGGVLRGNDAFIAVGDTRIQKDDRVAVFTMPSCAKDVDKLFK